MRLLAILLFLTIFSSSQSCRKDINNNLDNQDTNCQSVERQPTFPGGIDSLKSFIKRNLIGATKELEKGKVFIQFIVNEDGTTSNHTIYKGLTKDNDEIALRISRKIPAWNPGTQNCIPVKVKIIMPVEFE